MDRFHQENPSITVQFVASAEKSGNGFAVLASSADTTVLYGMAFSEANTYFQNLQPWMEADAQFQADDFWPDALSACQSTDGLPLGVPLALSVRGIFFDAAVFEAADVAQPAPGWTLDDLRHALSMLANRIGSDAGFVLADPGSALTGPQVLAHLAQHDGLLDALALEQEIQWYLDLVKAKMIDVSATGDEAGPSVETDARPALRVGSLESLAASEMAFAPFPVFADDMQAKTTPGWAQCAVISAGSQHPQAAWMWLDFLSRQRLTASAESGGLALIPARRSVADSGYWDVLPAGAEASVHFALEHTWYRGAWQEMAAVSAAVEKLAAGAVDFVSILAATQGDLAAVSQPAVTTQPVVVASPEPTLDASAEATVVKYYANAYHPSAVALMDTVVDAFNRNQAHVIVRWSNEYPQNGSQDALADLSSQYDCFTTDAPDWQKESSDNLLGLAALLNTEPALFTQDFYPALFDLYRFDGDVYGLPATSQPGVIAYNADLLARRGLSLPTNDWSFDEFLDMATAATSMSEADRSYGYMSFAGDWLLIAGSGMQQADLFSYPPAAHFDTPEVLSMFQWMAGLNQSSVLLTETNENFALIGSAISSGKVAFWRVHAGEELGAYFPWDEKSSFEIGVAPIPLTPNRDHNILSGLNYGHYISRQTQTPQACWTWIKFLTEQPNAFLGVPARRSVAESAAWEATVGQVKADAYRQALSQIAQVEQEADEQDRIIGPFYSLLHRAILETLMGSDPAQALAAAQSKADAYTACISPYDPNKLTIQEIQDKVDACVQQINQ